MSKHDLLTEEEMSKFTMNPDVLRYIEHFRDKMGLKNQEMTILDWGCGRGRSVAYLRQHGYEAYGVDIDPEPIENAKELFLKRGLDANEILTTLNGENKTRFPDNFFDFIFSWQVFEHVKNLDQVAAELARITKPGGVGLHVYPGHRYIVEGHLFMPFIHWLPKNKLRKIGIHLWLLLGKDPKWPQLEGKSKTEKAGVYYEYSINKTFYRSWRTVRNIFERNGWGVDFPFEHKLKKLGFFYTFTKFKPVRLMAIWGFLNFRSVELVTIKEDIF